MSQLPGPITHSPFSFFAPTRTPGPLGHYDAAYPVCTAVPGDTPGTLGINDAAALLAKGSGNLSSLQRESSRSVAENEIASTPVKIPCGHNWTDLKDLIDELIKAKSVMVTLSRFTYSRQRISTFEVDFQRKDGSSRVRSWEYGETLKPLSSGDKWPSVYFNNELLQSRKPSTTSADLALFRREAQKHLRLFREVVGEINAPWWKKHQTDLQVIERWVVSWKGFERDRCVITPGEPDPLSGASRRREPPVNEERLLFSVDVDEEFIKKLKEKLGAPNVCEVHPMKVHFNFDRPYSMDDEQGVLQNPEELERVAQELKKIINISTIKLHITVIGQTDASGTQLHNLGLSQRRAHWLLNRLKKHLAGFDLSKTRIEVFGHGEALASQNPQRNPAERFAVILVKPEPRR